MSQSDIDTIYKSLRLLPEFDGNPHVLTRFIHLCDQLVLAHFNTEPGNELSNLALINGILNKVTGPAAMYINANGIAENWSGIRSRIRCMRPETMEKALEYVQDELNTLYLQSRNENGPCHKKEWPPQSLSNQNFNLPLNNFVPKLSNAPTFPRQPLFNIPSTSRQPIQHHSQGWRPNNMPNNNSPRGFTRTQQMFRAPPPNYNPILITL
ncbi:hypothetical protein ACJJTC_000803 [Scirpophaga incertulas]